MFHLCWNCIRNRIHRWSRTIARLSYSLPRGRIKSQGNAYQMWLLRQTGQRTCHYALWRSDGRKYPAYSSMPLLRYHAFREAEYSCRLSTASLLGWSGAQSRLFLYTQVCVYTSWIVRGIVVQRGESRIIIDLELKPRLRYYLLRRLSRIKDFVDVPRVQSYLLRC